MWWATQEIVYFSLIMNDELLLLRSLLHSVKIRCWARCSHNHRLVLFSKNDFALGRLSLHVHVLSLHEILFLVDVSSLNFVIERRWSVLAWNTGQRLSLVSINSSLSVGLSETECLRDLASSSCWVRHNVTLVVCDDLRLNRRSFIHFFGWKNACLWSFAFFGWQKDLRLRLAHEVLMPRDRLWVLFLSVLTTRSFVSLNTYEVLRRKVSLRWLDVSLRLMVDAMPGSCHGLDVSLGMLVAKAHVLLFVSDICIHLQ